MKWIHDNTRWLHEHGARCLDSQEGYAMSWTVISGRRKFSAWRSVGESRSKHWTGWKINYALGERVPAVRFDLLGVFDDVGAARAYCEAHYLESEKGAASD